MYIGRITVLKWPNNYYLLIITILDYLQETRIFDAIMSHYYSFKICSVSLLLQK